MENHAGVTEWQKLFSSHTCVKLSAAVAIATFEIYGWKFTGYLILICSFSWCWQKFSKTNCFRVYRKLITWSTNAKRPISTFVLTTFIFFHSQMSWLIMCCQEVPLTPFCRGKRNFALDIGNRKLTRLTWKRKINVGKSQVSVVHFVNLSCGSVSNKPFLTNTPFSLPFFSFLFRT